MSPPRVVLVRPRNPANVGFVARALANFGLRDWALVSAPPLRGSEAELTGAPAREILDAARLSRTLDEAAAGCTHLVGFTARGGRHRALAPLAALPPAAAAWGPAARPAFLFGPEDHGLEADETERCALLVTIPAPGLASFNLSHAVAVVLYEWFRDREPAARGPGAMLASWATTDDRTRLARKALELLAEGGFPDRGGELEAALRRLAAAPMEARDLRVLERVVRHARWLREREREHGPAS